ncbi:MAG: hypothetical protein BWY83_00501 [bacterium ADurb.Bin478]|nr:MAG: hypothetical protein BWY83_00501 [bacterium ADurb.Bin478]
MIAEKNGHDRRRRFVGAEPVIVGRRGDGGAQQIAIVIDGAQDGGEKYQELQVLLRRFAGLEQIVTLRISHGPVVVFAAAVDAGKGLFVQQQRQSVAVGRFFQNFHDQLIAVGSHIGFGKDRRNFELMRRHLVVAGFGRHAHFVELDLRVLHESEDAVLDGAKVMVLQLLSLGRFRAQQRSAGDAQVRTQRKKRLVDEKILLLGADGGDNPVGFAVAEEPQYFQG